MLLGNRRSLHREISCQKLLLHGIQIGLGEYAGIIFHQRIGLPHIEQQTACGFHNRIMKRTVCHVSTPRLFKCILSLYNIYSPETGKVLFSWPIGNICRNRQEIKKVFLGNNRLFPGKMTKIGGNYFRLPHRGSVSAFSAKVFRSFCRREIFS